MTLPWSRFRRILGQEGRKCRDSLPRLKPGHLLVRTSASLISNGTESLMVEFGRARWAEEAKQIIEVVR